MKKGNTIFRVFLAVGVATLFYSVAVAHGLNFHSHSSLEDLTVVLLSTSTTRSLLVLSLNNHAKKEHSSFRGPKCCA